MTTPEQRQWDLLTGPVRTGSTPNAPITPSRAGSTGWVDERIKTRSEIASQGHRRLKISAEERTGLTTKVATFTELHELATVKDQLVSPAHVN